MNGGIRRVLAKTVLILGMAMPGVLLAQPDHALRNWSAPAYWQPGARPAASGGRFASKAQEAGNVNSTPLPFVALTPCRLADTRGNGFLPPFGPPSLSPGITRDFPVAGNCGVPVDAAAVSFNFTVQGTMGTGFLATYPQGEAWPGNSTLNYYAGDILANNAVVALGSHR